MNCELECMEENLKWFWLHFQACRCRTHEITSRLCKIVVGKSSVGKIVEINPDRSYRATAALFITEECIWCEISFLVCGNILGPDCLTKSQPIPLNRLGVLLARSSYVGVLDKLV